VEVVDDTNTAPLPFARPGPAYLAKPTASRNQRPSRRMKGDVADKLQEFFFSPDPNGLGRKWFNFDDGKRLGHSYWIMRQWRMECKDLWALGWRADGG